MRIGNYCVSIDGRAFSQTDSYGKEVLFEQDIISKRNELFSKSDIRPTQTNQGPTSTSGEELQ